MSGQMMLGQLLVGIINGSFYAILSLGLSITFGVLRIANFAHGAHYMVGAITAWMLLHYLGIGYWWALLLSPLAVAAFAYVFEKTLLWRMYKLDHLYGLLLTLGASLILEGLFLNAYGSGGLPYSVPKALVGGVDLGFILLPYYRVWVIATSIAICLLTWFVIERTRIGSYLRAATENPVMVGALGINVPLLVTITYAASAALAGITGVLAAPLYSANPLMGTDILIVIFAIVVIGGLGSVTGSIVTAYGIGILEAFTTLIYPEGSKIVAFVVMIIVLLARPTGLFGKAY